MGAMGSWFGIATRGRLRGLCSRRLLRVAAALALASVCLASPSLAAQPIARSTVRLASAALSPEHLLHVRGTVRHVQHGVRVRLEFRAAKAPTGPWKWLGRSEPIGANGGFTVSVRVPDDESTLAVRAVLVRGNVVLVVGRAEDVSISAISVLGSKTTQPATSMTPATASPGPTMTSPSPTCPDGDAGEFPDCEPPPPNPDKGTTLTSGEALTEGDYLESNGGQYKLIMQGDGNLVLYHEGNALWSSETGGNPDSYAIMEGEGNLVVYDGTTAKWNSSTWGFPGAYLSLQEEGNLVVYQDGHPVWDWASGYLGDELNQWKLEPGAYLLSPNHEYELIMQSSDGNLVLYHDGQALWSSATGGEPGSYAVMQGDGNFVIYKPHSGPWSTGTAGHPGAFLRVQNDDNVVVYDGGTALWDWESGLLSGGGGPTAAETAAVNWAVARIGSTSYYNLCLTFVQDAYQDGAGLNIQPLTKYGAFNSNTYPQQVWDDGFNSGTTGGSNTTPPYGALVFFNDPSDYEYSHVAIMGSGGEMISTPDAFDESAVHYETLGQAAHSGAYAAYVGWWLPDG
jgi:cell wall-associated NlpC family hydrolase